MQQQRDLRGSPTEFGWHSFREYAKQQQQHGRDVFFNKDGSSINCAMQPTLQFADAELERRFVASQAQQWAHMDGAFVAVTLLLLGATLYGSSSRGLQQQLLLSLGHWLMPAVAGCWLMLQPHSYGMQREAVWAVHRVLAAVQTAGVLVLCMLQQQWQVAGAAAGVAAAGVAAQSVAGMLRRRALAMLVESLGFKVSWLLPMLLSLLSQALVPNSSSSTCACTDEKRCMLLAGLATVRGKMCRASCSWLCWCACSPLVGDGM
jgi:hypothetical protein